MKKKIMAALLAGVMMLTGCSSEGKITVGEYKGLAITEVSQATVDEEIQEMLESNAELVEVQRAAEDGDTVNIDYVGTKDGVAFDGGTATGSDLVLGSDSFIDGFEDGLIGAVAGEVRDLNLTFPENYSNADLAGAAVVFTVTVNSVKETVLPELTDEFIAEKSTQHKTVAEYTEALREALNYQSFYEQITEQLMASSTVEKYNEAVVLQEKQAQIDYYTSYATYYGSYYGLDELTSIQYFLGFETEEAFHEEMGEYAYEVVKNEMIVREIAKAEKIEVTDEIFDTKAAEYAEAYSYEDVASFLEAYPEEDVRLSILAELVMDFLIDNAVIAKAE